MGDLVDLNEWKKKKEEEEESKIKNDIDMLHAELKHIISEMESEDAPFMYDSEWLSNLPSLISMSMIMDGYAEYEDTSSSATSPFEYVIIQDEKDSDTDA
jgi:hypothetical protein|tara:strand:- start:2680 stop:2979 length:300 start_codon:yes stop_codon:yes gene_type:complete